MLIDFVTLNNVFDDPDSLVEFAKRQKFMTMHEHPNASDGKTYFDGVRSLPIDLLDKNLFHRSIEEIFTKVLKNRFLNDEGKIKYTFGYTATSYFHIMKQKDQFQEMWKHTDPNAIMAGLVYLNKNPKPDSGTTIYTHGGEKLKVPNEYNKLVLYSSSMPHHPDGGFGEDAEDGRLTLVFFVEEFRVRFELDQPKPQ